MNEPVANSFSNPFATTSNPFSNPFATASNTIGRRADPQGRLRAARGQLQLCRRRASQPGRRVRASDAAARARRPIRPAQAARHRLQQRLDRGRRLADHRCRGEESIRCRAATACRRRRCCSANGLNSPAQVHGGMRLVVPVYNASDKTAAAAPIAPATAKPSSKQGLDAAAEDDTKSKKSADKDKTKAKKTDLPEKDADASAAKTKANKTDKVQEGRRRSRARPSPRRTKPRAAKSRSKTRQGRLRPRRRATDPTPTGHVGSSGSSAGRNRRAGRRHRHVAGIPLARARAHHSGLQGGRQRRHQHFRARGHFGARGGKRRRRLCGQRVEGLRQSRADPPSQRLRLAPTPTTANSTSSAATPSSAVRSSPSPGQSGNVNSPQLHFELRKGSTPVDPTAYLAGL